MKRTLSVTLLMASAMAAFSQGQVNFNNRVTANTGQEGTAIANIYQPIYGINPANPTQNLQGTPNANGPGGAPLPAVGTTDYSGRTPLAGTGFTAQLWYGTVGMADANLVLANSATTTFRTSATTVGAFNFTTASLDNPALLIPGGAGSRAQLQVRAWDNKNGAVTSWSAVLSDPTVARGYSTSFVIPFDLGAGTTPIPNIIGMQSFGLFTVPEPSLIALGALGLGALLLRRRKA